MTYGIKIAKPGKSVNSTDLRDLSVDLNTFSMFKLHSSSTSSVTLNAGDSEKSATISHSLGYVPAFLVYYKRSDESVERLIPDIPFGVDFDFHPWAYATTTGIIVGYSCKQPYNRIICPVEEYYDTLISDGQQWITGKAGSNGVDGAFRFVGVPLSRNESIADAFIDVRVTGKGSSGQNIDMKLFGIDEDDTGSFSSYPMGRSVTDASYDISVSAPATPFGYGLNVKNCLTEIIGRSGWNAGNAMGFLTFNRASVDNTYIASDSSQTQLVVTKPGSLTVSFRVIIFKDKISS